MHKLVSMRTCQNAVNVELSVGMLPFKLPKVTCNPENKADMAIKIFILSINFLNISLLVYSSRSVFKYVDSMCMCWKIEGKKPPSSCLSHRVHILFHSFRSVIQ